MKVKTTVSTEIRLGLMGIITAIFMSAISLIVTSFSLLNIDQSYKEIYGIFVLIIGIILFGVGYKVFKEYESILKPIKHDLKGKR